VVVAFWTGSAAVHKYARVIGCIFAFFAAGCSAASYTVVDSAAVSIAPEVENDPAKAAIALTYLKTITDAKQAYLEADRTDAATFKKAEDDLVLNHDGAALNDLLELRASFPDSVKWAGRDIRVNAVIVDEAIQAAVLTTDETWAVTDQAEKDLFRETNALHTVELRMVTRPNGGEGWVVSEFS
jgi:hypothetical protein